MWSQLVCFQNLSTCGPLGVSGWSSSASSRRVPQHSSQSRVTQGLAGFCWDHCFFPKSSCNTANHRRLFSMEQGSETMKWSQMEATVLKNNFPSNVMALLLTIKGRVLLPGISTGRGDHWRLWWRLPHLSNKLDDPRKHWGAWGCGGRAPSARPCN